MFRVQTRRLFSKLRWTDSEDVAEKLFESNKALNPLSLRFTDLQAMVCKLPEFAEKPEQCSESKLEKIQMAWLELYEEK